MSLHRDIVTPVTQHNLLSGDKHGDLIGSQVGALLSILFLILVLVHTCVCGNGDGNDLWEVCMHVCQV